jgi:hypothetical protein
MLSAALVLLAAPQAMDRLTVAIPSRDRADTASVHRVFAPGNGFVGSLCPPAQRTGESKSANFRLTNDFQAEHSSRVIRVFGQKHQLKREKERRYHG